MTQHHLLTSSQHQDFRTKLKTIYKRIRKELNAVARQFHLCCSTCASYDLWERASAKNKPNVVFSHKQDTSQYEYGIVPIRYGTGGNSRDSDQALGVQISKIVQEEGLNIDWDNDPCSVILIKYPIPS